MMLLSLQDFLTQFLRERVDAEFLITWLIATAVLMITAYRTHLGSMLTLRQSLKHQPLQNKD